MKLRKVDSPTWKEKRKKKVWKIWIALFSLPTGLSFLFFIRKIFFLLLLFSCHFFFCFVCLRQFCFCHNTLQNSYWEEEETKKTRLWCESLRYFFFYSKLSLHLRDEEEAVTQTNPIIITWKGGGGEKNQNKMGVVGQNVTFPQQVQENKINRGRYDTHSLIPLSFLASLKLLKGLFLHITCTHITGFVISG